MCAADYNRVIDYTLDNVVRIMSKEDEKGVSFFTQAGIQALATRTFNNLTEVRKHKNQLRSETELVISWFIMVAHILNLKLT